MQEKRLRVLIVDDEDEIGQAIQSALDDQLEILLSLNGVSALEILRREHKAIDVIFCDLMMPVMDGIELYRKVQAEMPGLEKRFVFTTGGATSEESGDFIEAMKSLVLFKPFSMEQFLRVIRDTHEANCEG